MPDPIALIGFLSAHTLLCAVWCWLILSTVHKHQDGPAGPIYWWLRGKHKLRRQVDGLAAQLEVTRKERDALELQVKQLRAWVKHRGA